MKFEDKEKKRNTSKKHTHIIIIIDPSTSTLHVIMLDIHIAFNVMFVCFSLVCRNRRKDEVAHKIQRQK